MTRDKKFVIDSIKMDLYRVVTATGDLTKEIPQESVETFLSHADKDFNKVSSLTPQEKEIRNRLKTLANNLAGLTDPKARLRWTEDVLTARCML
jgi:hypothetical protein